MTAILQDREYQTYAVDSLWAYFALYEGNPLVAMPTGTGKSVVIARFLQSVLRQFASQRILVLTHVKELIKQNFGKLKTVWPFAPASIYSAGLNTKDASQSIVFAGIASIVKIWHTLGKINLIIVDECHLIGLKEEGMYRTLINGLKQKNPNLKVIGFTATPWRQGQGLLTDPVTDKYGKTIKSMFDDFACDATTMSAFNWFIDEGYLVPLIPKDTSTQLDITGVQMQGGEFVETQLQRAVNRDDITMAALQEAMVLGAKRKKWLIFSSGIEHAEAICDMLNDLGIPTGCIHSKRADRDEVLAKYARGELRAIVNNNVLTTGFDEPGIDLIIMLRPTASAILWVQMLGRGTRPFWGNHDFNLNTKDGRLAAILNGKQNCMVLDYAGNTSRLGPINDPVIPRPKGNKPGPAPVKKCEICNTWCHISARYCHTKDEETGYVCTYEFPFKIKIETVASSHELLKKDLPKVKVFDVNVITVAKHEKDGSPDMVKVTYYCGNRRFTDILGFEHTNYLKRKTVEWWRRCVGATKNDNIPAIPETTDRALEVLSRLAMPTQLRVWTNRKPYPEILAYCFDGTSFGETPFDEEHAVPEFEGPQAAKEYVMDDDIPF